MIDAQRYHRRRTALLAQLARGPLLVRGAAASGGSANFRYLTGVAEPRAALLAATDGIRIGFGRAHPGPDYQRGRIAHELLFLPRQDPLLARWGEGSKATVETLPPAEAGVDAVLSLDELDDVLGRTLQEAPNLNYVRASSPTLAGADDGDTVFVERLRRRFFGLRVFDATPLVHEMRRVKEGDEVRAIERSAGVIAEALAQVRPLIRPGTRESEIEAEISRIYRLQGGTHAFEPIVAAGANALKLHYTENSGRLAAGELVLIDTGASIDGYKGDVTRTFPVDGAFTERQRQIYDLVLSAQRAAIAACRPGATLGDVHASAYQVIAQAGLGSHFVHGTSHHLGLDTHDVGDPFRALAPGNVITVEPGVYLEQEGIGIRIEDDILVTEGGPRVLTETIPR